MKDMEMLEALDGAVGTPLTTSCSWNYTGINTTREPFTDPKVRYAMALAKDRNALIESVYFGYGSPINGDITPDWTGGNSGREYFGEPNIELAKELLAEAGYPDGFDTTFTVSPQYPWHLAAAEMYQADLAKIGINAELIILEWGAFLDAVFGDRDFDLQQCGWGGPFVDPDEFLYPEYHSGEGWNMTEFSDPEVDRLLEAGRNTLDPEKRKEIYYEVQKLIVESAPIVAGANIPWLMIHWDNVNDFDFLPTGMLKSFRHTYLSE
jgi:peptide/nickel transport system substrate-binding protein